MSCSRTDLVAAGSTVFTSWPSLVQRMVAGGLESTRQLRVAVRTESVRAVTRDRWTLGPSVNTSQGQADRLSGKANRENLQRTVTVKVLLAG